MLQSVYSSPHNPDIIQYPAHLAEILLYESVYSVYTVLLD